MTFQPIGTLAARVVASVSLVNSMSKQSECVRRYQKSPKGRATLAKYLASPKGKAKRRRVLQKYWSSEQGRFMALFHRIKERHIAKWGRPFSLTINDLKEIWKTQNGRCAISGVQMTWGRGRFQLTSVSVDRIDNSVGYIKGNIRFICHSVNVFRSVGTDEEMIEMARAIVAHANLATMENR